MVSTLKHALIIFTLLVVGCTTVPLQPNITQPTFASPVVKQDASSVSMDSLIEKLTKEDVKESSLVKRISSQYKKDERYVDRIVTLADKYAYKDFPTKLDILAVMAVESAFNNTVCYHGSCGLMQIELKSHRKKGITRSNYKQLETNIRIGSEILREYFLLSKKNKKGTFLAYNAGIGNYQKGRYKTSYYSKIVKAKKGF